MRRNTLDENNNEIKPKRNRHFTVVQTNKKLSLVPTVENVMNDAISILAKEVAELKNRLNRPGVAMSAEESTKLSKIVKSLVDISREERARESVDDLSNLTNEQLIELARKQMLEIQNSAAKKAKPTEDDNSKT